VVQRPAVELTPAPAVIESGASSASTSTAPRWKQRLPRLVTGALAACCLVLALLAVLLHGQLDGTKDALARSQQDLASAKTTIGNLNQDVQGLQAKLAAPPQFIEVASAWNGSCDAAGCPVTATFRNNGGEGSSVAVFTITSLDHATNYGSCTATIASVPNHSSSSAGCKVTTGPLGDFIRAHPANLPLTFQVDVRNP
jgi:hypothetical protein